MIIRVRVSAKLNRVDGPVNKNAINEHKEAKISMTLFSMNLGMKLAIKHPIVYATNDIEKKSPI